MSNRNIEIKVRLNRKEAEALNKRVKKSRLSREAYLRHLIKLMPSAICSVSGTALRPKAMTLAV